MMPWLMISIAVILILLLIFMFIFRKYNRPQKIDYLAWFMIGAVWAVTGIVSMVFSENENFFFAIMGFAFMLIALAHKREWKANRKDWLNKRHRPIMIAAIILLAIIIVLMIVRH
jgi:drug/metabolite transporter (DMT)-like permease